jgi:glutamine synthetase
MLLYKYVVHQVANAYGKTATFMPKPIFGDNGLRHARPHVDLEEWQADLRWQRICRPLRKLPLSSSADVIKHAKAVNAFTNPLTNSYKRLVPGYEAPVLLAYSARNRSASCRIPFGSSPKVEARRSSLPRSGRETHISPSRPC